MVPDPTEPDTSRSRSDFCGRQVVWAGLIGGVGGFLLGQFLRMVVARTPTQLPSYALFWLIVLLSAMGCLGAMAIEAVRQLQTSNPNPAYHRLRQQRQRQAAERQRRRGAR
jgi:nitrate/nitrite transporter NarK